MPDSSVPNGTRGLHDETDTDRLRGILALDALSVGLVSALAGDRPLTEAEESSLSKLKEGRGELFFPDLLYAITHQYFSPVAAKKLWEEILRHKYEMSKALNRNAQIVVATLDYLANLKSAVHLPTLVNENHIAAIVNQSMRDGLTGLFNHTSCHELINLELKRYARHGTVVSLIFTDIDDFKVINDECGHQEGDHLLKELAATIEHTTRDSDMCCRYGGEEFAVILPLTNARAAAEIAERMRLEAMQIHTGGRTLTVSSGVASCSETTTTAHALVEVADRALYQAKHGGKNRVVVV
ncbi:MAG: GGDEF domain-containing protein [Kiritimatiellae bacterium]|nr:GGDEF domain-containing protein [Kiritimatiellia bacterium]